MASNYRNHHHGAFDVEKAATVNAFAERTIRQGFVRKVFGLLAAQLALTTAIASFFVFSPTVKSFLLTNPWILAVSLFASFAIVLTFSFSSNARQSHPLNLILLFAFTAAEGVLVGAASSHARTDIVVLAFGLTAGITAAMALWALTTKHDITMSGSALYACLLGLIFAGVVGFFVRTTLFNMAISAVGAVLFSIYIAFDVQSLLGGEHKYAISPDEYVMGAIAIYLDVINLFIHILRLLSSNDRS